MKKLLIFTLVLILLFIKQVKADIVYSENAVWIQDEGWPAMNKNILSTNLTKVLNDLGNGSIKYAFVFVGYWNNSTNNINYQHSDAFFTNVINALHSVNVKAIAWAEAYNAPMDIRVSNRQNIYNSIIACMNKGFDGYNDDIEPPLIGTHQDQIDYWNNLTPILHGLGKLNMPDVGFDWEQNTNQYLNVDYIVSMFYSSRSTLEDPQAPYYWQEEFGEFNGHNTPPASPVILGIMNYYGNAYPLAWQLGQVEKYLSTYGHPQLAGFSLWLYEYMGTNPDDWNQWNYWINQVGINSVPLYTINFNSSPITGVQLSYNGVQHYTPDVWYTFNGTTVVNAPSQVSNENHNVLFGDSDHTGGSEGYNVYTYAGGPYNLTSSASISSLYFYCTATGNVKLAIYNATTYNINGWVGTNYHPYMLQTQSNPTSCNANSWKLINVPSATLPAGIYFIAIKGDTTGIIGVSGLPVQKVGGDIYGYDQFITESYGTAFKQLFPTVEGAMGNNPSVYVPTTPFTLTTYNFAQWEDSSTNPTRTINLNSNATITALYTTSSIVNKISGTLKDKNNQPVQSKIIVYQNGTNNIINSTTTDSNGNYILSLSPGTYDIQFNLTNFFIPDYSIKLYSIDITNDISNIIKSITSNLSGKVSIILDINNSQTVQIYGTRSVSNVKKNNNALTKAFSQSNLRSNSWFYQSPNLYFMVAPDFFITAASGSVADIQAAVNQVDAAGGGTVYIPAGDFVFTPTESGAVKIPGGVNVIGAGKGVTILRHTTRPTYTEWPSGYFFYVDGKNNNGKSVRISGISFIGFREIYPNDDARTRGIAINEVTDFRVDNCIFKDTGGGGVDVIDWDTQSIITRGVIDRCDFINTNGNPCGPGGIASGPNVLGYGIGVYGSGKAADWTDDIDQILGKYDYGRSAVYIEDTYFSRWRHDVASNNGAHYVFRYNTIEIDSGFGTLDAHGGGYGNEGVGTRAVEIYNNVIKNPTLAYLWNTGNVSEGMFYRGGGGAVFNNTVQNYTHFLVLSDEGSDSKYWPHDLWIWNNTLSNTQTLISPGNRVENTDYFLYQKPSYTPYTYPHPLTISS